MSYRLMTAVVTTLTAMVEWTTRNRTENQMFPIIDPTEQALIVNEQLRREQAAMQAPTLTRFEVEREVEVTLLEAVMAS